MKELHIWNVQRVQAGACQATRVVVVQDECQATLVVMQDVLCSCAWSE